MMDRLQKKCFVAAVSFHGALFLILIFGAAMMARDEDKNAWHPITVFDPNTVSDGPTLGGGPQRDSVVPSAPIADKKTTPVPPDPKPVEQPVQKPKTPKPEVRHNPKPPEPKPIVERTKPRENDLLANPVEAKHTPKHLDNSDLVPAKHTEKLKPASSESTEETAAKDARRRAAKEFASSMRSLSKSLSSSELVAPTFGSGSDGAASVNYRDIIASKYYNAWSAPLELDDATPIVVASITIARDGSVKSAHITKKSGNAAMDRSIQNLLDIVTFIEPFPAGSKDSERTVTVKFSVQAKRQTG